MGKAAKGSRKGKKAWRVNISTADIEDYFENSTKETLAGVTAPPQTLFFVDKSDDVPPKRKIEKKKGESSWEKSKEYVKLSLELSHSAAHSRMSLGRGMERNNVLAGFINTKIKIPLVTDLPIIFGVQK